MSDVCRAVGVRAPRIEVNSLGDANCRPAYRRELAAFGRRHCKALCADCLTRLERNPLRLLDCKKAPCRAITAEAPVMTDRLCDGCRRHHQRVLELLGAVGVDVVANPRMVRGLDYYCRTAFEVIAEGLGAQDAIGGGGRYDGLVEALGGPPVAGVGFAFGIDRLELACPARSGEMVPPEFLVAPIGDAAAPIALQLARRLRSALYVVELENSARKLKAQLRRADKTGARYAILIGDEEIAAGRASVRDLAEHVDYPRLIPLHASAAEIVAAIEERKTQT